MIWSKSQLQTYKQCPQRFYLENFTKQVGDTSPQIQLTRGTTFHKTAELLYGKIDFGELHRMGSEDQIKDYLRGLMPNDEDPYLNDLYDNFAIEEADRWTRTKQAKELDADRYFKPIFSEVEVVNEKRSIRGKIDWIFRAFDDEYVIGEIKTGKEYEISEIRKELCFLVLLVEDTELLDKTPKYIMCYYPRTNQVIFEEPKPQSFAALWRMYEYGQKGLASKDFHKEIGFLCGFCPFMDPCLTEEELASLD